MKAIFTQFLLISASIILSSSIFGQRFVASTALPVNLNSGSTNFTSCPSNLGNKPTVSFTVSGLATSLTSTFALASIDLSFDLGCGVNYRDLQLYIMSPSGNCMMIYNHFADGNPEQIYTGVIAGGTFNASMRDASCLSIPNLITIPDCGKPICRLSDYSFPADLPKFHAWPLNTNKTDGGNHGVFKANTTTNMSTFFSGINPNGTWTIYASEGSTTNSSPCISAASLTFGNPTVTDLTAAGDECSTPIIWSGQSICASTVGKTGSSASPGNFQQTNGNSLDYSQQIGGTPCLWNADRNNDVWVRFTPNPNPTGGPICISISGLTGNLQSVVVTDLNADSDANACTQLTSPTRTKTATNDPFWKVVSCPTTGSTSKIYQTYSAGTRYNQQHCFIPEPNKTYYLVVEGTAGTTSPFFITGITGPLQSILSTTGPSQQSFVSNTRKESETPVSMTGGLLKTNAGNKKFNQQILIYDSFGNLIYTTRRTASGFSELNLYQFMRTGFNVIKIKDDQGGDYTFKLLK